MMKQLHTLISIFFFCFSTLLFSQNPEWINDTKKDEITNAIIPDFQVNEDVGNCPRKSSPSISSDGSGNFVITWGGGGTGDYDIYAQRYSSDGTALANNFKVNDVIGSAWNSSRGGITSPSISTDGSGNFVITWEDQRDGDWDIYAQRYSSDGTELGSNYQVNESTGSAGWTPSISTDGSGNFVITWEDQRDGDWDIYAQRYSSDGTELGSNYQVNEITGSARQYSPSISSDGSGNFVITWTNSRNEDIDNESIDIYAQRYSNDGTELGSNFQVNEITGSARQYSPSISSDGSGNFVITWIDDRNEASVIYAQRYSDEGTALARNLKVNDDEGSASYYSNSISSDRSGSFVITWGDLRNGVSDIYAQCFTSDGNAAGTNFNVNEELGSAWHYFPSIATDDSGNFVITWTHGLPENSDIYAQRYSIDGTALAGNFKVNDDFGSAWQEAPSIAIDGGGNFIITWVDKRNGDPDIYAQRFVSDGSAVGTNFKVNDDLESTVQEFPCISTGGSGNFVITWGDERNGDSDIYTQRYSSNGSTIGTNFKVNDDEGSEGQYSPSISSDSIGNFVITWGDARDSAINIYAQCYSSDGSAIGGNFKVTNTGSGSDVNLWNGRIYNTWTDNRGNETGYDIWANVLDWDNPVGISEKDMPQIPSAYKISQNYPNPFNPTTVISYHLPVISNVDLCIYNLLGQRIATLVSERQNAGYHQIEWDAGRFSSGIYYYKVRAGEFQDVKKMVLLR